MNGVLAPSRLFGDGAIVAEHRGAGDRAVLHPDEAACCATFGNKRAAEFAAGRACARRALGELGYADFALLPRPDRSPRWPDGIVGSITHTDGFAAAVVARRERFRAVGLDAEIAGRITSNMWSLLFTARDIAQLADARSAERRAILATIIFSAKEAFYKCQFAVTERWVEFHDVSVIVAGGSGGTFAVEAECDSGPLAELLPLTGRFELEGDLVRTAVALSASEKPPALR